jgi:stress-induced morphogen
MSLTTRFISNLILRRPRIASSKPKNVVGACLNQTTRFSTLFCFQTSLRSYQLRHYCTFRNSNSSFEIMKPYEAEEVENKIDEEEIPLMESHWDSFVQELTDRLKDRLNAPSVEILDKTRPGCGTVIEIHVSSSKFSSLSKPDQTRLVTQSLQGLLDDVHAVTIKTRISS